MKQQILQKAIALGFDACRFTTAAPPESASRFQDWLASQQHGEMNYLQRNALKRVEPERVLPGARTVIALAASYASGAEPNHTPQHPPLKNPAAHPAEDSGFPAHHPARERHGQEQRAGQGCIARYARFADYHEVLRARLKELTALVNNLGGPATRSLSYVDTGPILERDLAQRAGIGFIGKHTNLISRRLGNWFFLAEIITTLELPPDSPEKNRCGACARCLAACPSGAIAAPFQLDARRCISYLTIELKGPIPEQFRPAIGRRIFGCDDCLEVCPWNRFAQEGRIMVEQARPDLAEPDLLELLALDETAFRRRFSGTPILRLKRRGFLRNVCVALGNIGTVAALSALAIAAQDSEPLIREHARWALAQLEASQVKASS